MPGLKLNLRTTCQACGNPIPLNSATLALECPSCDAPKTLAAADFAWIMNADVRPRPPYPMHKSADTGAVMGEVVAAAVACGACETSLDDDAIEGAWAEGQISCACGQQISARPVPEQLDSDRWWTAVIGEATKQSAVAAQEPVSFACTSCGAGLQVDGTTRSPHCQYCSTSVFIPDELWQAVRPTPKTQPFYLWIAPTQYRQWSSLKAKRTRVMLLTAALVIIGMAGAFAATSFFEPTAGFFIDSDSNVPAPWYGRAGYSLAFSWMVAWAAASYIGSKILPQRAHS